MNTEALHQLCRQILEHNGPIDKALVQKIEALYEEALLGNYLAERQSAMDALQSRVAERAKATPTESPAPPEIDEPVQDTAKNFGDEVKVLPHPEGPPKPAPRETPAEESAPEPIEEEVKQPEPEKPKAPQPPKEVIEALEHRTATSTPGSNNRLKNLNIGLNDRIAFVKQLFMGSQEDYHRVVSQINTMDDYDETIGFVRDVVKPDYDWSKVEETEERLLELIANRFGK